jgi:hypothetical protein
MEQRSILITGAAVTSGRSCCATWGVIPISPRIRYASSTNMQRGSYRALFDLPAMPNVRFLEADLLESGVAAFRDGGNRDRRAPGSRRHDPGPFRA